MSPRTRVTFAKRQKEQARQEKQRAKAQRKLQRKLESQTAAPPARPEEIGGRKGHRGRAGPGRHGGDRGRRRRG